MVFLLLLFSHLVISDFLLPHWLQHARPFCPSPSPEVCPSSCPLHRWCHPVISFSDTLFSFGPQSFPASRTFPMSWLFTSDDQNTGASASPSDLPMSIQGSFPLRLTSLIFLLSKGPQECSPAPQFQSINSLVLSFLYGPTLISIHAAAAAK